MSIKSIGSSLGSLLVLMGLGLSASSAIAADFVRDRGASQKIWGRESTKPMTWYQAKRYCANLRDNGIQWVLPSAADFMRFGKNTNFDRRNEIIAGKLKMRQGVGYWSDSPNPRNADLVWIMFNGELINEDPAKQSSVYARCVSKLELRHL